MFAERLREARPRAHASGEKILKIHLFCNGGNPLKKPLFPKIGGNFSIKIRPILLKMFDFSSFFIIIILSQPTIFSVTLAIFGHFWYLMVSTGDFYVLLVPFGHFGHLWSMMVNLVTLASFGHF